MIEVRPFASLGHAHHGWLNARHHFSFAEYQDPQRVNWGRLRVWNDDEIAAGSGFPPHPHHDMEIITYVREGAITHRDNLSNQGRTEAGDVQVMSAGTGIAHSEYNLEDVTTKIFQIWIIPDQQGEAPAWGAKPFPRGERAGQFVVLASGHDSDADALRQARAAEIGQIGDIVDTLDRMIGDQGGADDQPGSEADPLGSADAGPAVIETPVTMSPASTAQVGQGGDAQMADETDQERG